MAQKKSFQMKVKISTDSAAMAGRISGSTMNQKIRHLGDTFDARRLDQLIGQGLDEVAHEEGAEAGLERDVKQGEAPVGVVHAKAERHVADRNHQDLERDEVARRRT